LFSFCDEFERFFAQVVENPPYCSAEQHCVTSTMWVMRMGGISSCKSDGTCPINVTLPQDICCDYAKSSVLSGCTSVTAADVDNFISQNNGPGKFCSNEKGCIRVSRAASTGVPSVIALCFSLVIARSFSIQI
jgi:hypothetical protein